MAVEVCPLLDCSKTWLDYLGFILALAAILLTVITFGWSIYVYRQTKAQHRGEIAVAWGEHKSREALAAVKTIIKTWPCGACYDSQGNVTNPRGIALGFLADTIDANKKDIKTRRDEQRDFWMLVGSSKLDKTFWTDFDWVWLHRARSFYNISLPLDMARAKQDWVPGIAGSPLKFKRHAVSTFCMKMVAQHYPGGKVLVREDWAANKLVWEGLCTQTPPINWENVPVNWFDPPEQPQAPDGKFIQALKRIWEAILREF